MKKVDNESKRTLDIIWNLASKNEDYYKLDKNKVFMALTIERLDITTISLCHYGEQNGDLMRDPEMLFWRSRDGDFYPFYFRNDYLGIEQFAGEVIDYNLIVSNKKQQEEQVYFACIWLKNIKEQQAYYFV
jgi:hypothetical protein